LTVKEVVERFVVEINQNTEGVQNPQTLDYQTDSQAFFKITLVLNLKEVNGCNRIYAYIKPSNLKEVLT
jgi:hypothetical protein